MNVIQRSNATAFNHFPNSYLFGIDSGIEEKTILTAGTPLLSIRAKSATDVVRRLLAISSISLFLNAGNLILWRLLYNATVSAASWVSVADNSAAEYDISSTAITGGTILLAGFLEKGKGANLKIDMFDYPNIFDAGILTLAGYNIGGGSGAAFFGMNFREYF